jgi:ubiquinone/menaquinone biosynthesis C-methylase UbiE
MPSYAELPRPEYPSTYFVADRSNADELRGLQVQDELITTSMGGVLPEQSDPTVFRRVLDVGCGTGGWLIALAHSLPSSGPLVGVDASRTFVEYARAQAVAAGVSERVEFHTADALLLLEFPNCFFDLVNHRFAMSWARTWDWYKLIHEYRRVAQPEGTIRCVEAELAVAGTSAFTTLRSLAHTAFYRAGHLLTPSGELTQALPALLHRYGLLDIQTRCMTLTYRAGTGSGERFCEDLRLGLRTMEPFLRKWVRLPGDYGDLCQQASREMDDPDFVATVPLVTVWGRSSPLEA